jgi:hypothetical protein
MKRGGGGIRLGKDDDQVDHIKEGLKDELKEAVMKGRKSIIKKKIEAGVRPV